MSTNAEIKQKLLFVCNKIDEVFSILSSNNGEIQRSIVRGAFLGSGSITDPNKQYHLELTLEDGTSGAFKNYFWVSVPTQQH